MKKITYQKDLTKFLYPSGGPGRELKNRLGNREVLLGAMINEYSRPSLAKIYKEAGYDFLFICLLYTSPSPRDGLLSRMPSSA